VQSPPLAARAAGLSRAPPAHDQEWPGILGPGFGTCHPPPSRRATRSEPREPRASPAGRAVPVRRDGPGAAIAVLLAGGLSDALDGFSTTGYDSRRRRARPSRAGRSPAARSMRKSSPMSPSATRARFGSESSALEPVPPRVRPARDLDDLAVHEEMVVDGVRVGDEIPLVAGEQGVDRGAVVPRRVLVEDVRPRSPCSVRRSRQRVRRAGGPPRAAPQRREDLSRTPAANRRHYLLVQIMASASSSGYRGPRKR
jgi:hypothetical protein